MTPPCAGAAIHICGADRIVCCVTRRCFTFAGQKEFGGEGCILADDMGLGKTLMSIALIWLVLKHSFAGKDGEKICKRIVVCCPTSLVFNWSVASQCSPSGLSASNVLLTAPHPAPPSRNVRCLQQRFFLLFAPSGCLVPGCVLTVARNVDAMVACIQTQFTT